MLTKEAIILILIELLGVGLQMTESKLVGISLIFVSSLCLWYILLPRLSEKLEAAEPRPPFFLWEGWGMILLLCVVYGWWISTPTPATIPSSSQVSSINQSGGITTGDVAGNVTINSNIEDPKLKLSPYIRNTFIWYNFDNLSNVVAYLVVLLEIKNPEGKPSIAQDFTLVLPGRSLPALMLEKDATFQALFGFSPNQIDMILLANEFLQYRCTTSPITTGTSVRGWLLFEILNSPNIDVITTSASITFTNIQDQPYSVSLQNIHRIPPLPPRELFKTYPDITYPFRERSTIEQMIKRSSPGKQ